MADQTFYLCDWNLNLHVILQCELVSGADSSVTPDELLWSFRDHLEETRPALSDGAFSLYYLTTAGSVFR